jgi:hypothetical protein
VWDLQRLAHATTQLGVFGLSATERRIANGNESRPLRSEALGHRARERLSNGMLVSIRDAHRLHDFLSLRRVEPEIAVQ